MKLFTHLVAGCLTCPNINKHYDKGWDQYSCRASKGRGLTYTKSRMSTAVHMPDWCPLPDTQEEE